MVHSRVSFVDLKYVSFSKMVVLNTFKCYCALLSHRVVQHGIFHSQLPSVSGIVSVMQLHSLIIIRSLLWLQSGSLSGSS